MSKTNSVVDDAPDKIVLAAAQTGEINKIVLFEAMTALSLRKRDPDETDAQSYVSYVEMDSIGQQLAKIYRELPEPTYDQKMAALAKKYPKARPTRRFDDDEEGDNADAQIDALAAEHRRQNPGLTHPQAVSAILATGKGRALFTRAQAANMAKNR
jgi:hypothetical protein